MAGGNVATEDRRRVADLTPLAGRIVKDHQQGRAEGTPHPDLPKPSESRGSVLDVHLLFIQGLLARWPSITALRVHEELRSRGFAGGYTIVKELVRRLRPKPDRVPVLRFETGKGQQCRWTSPSTRSTSPKKDAAR